jgi:hypothetical protein
MAFRNRRRPRPSFPRPTPPDGPVWTPAHAGPGKDADVIRFNSWDAFTTDCQRAPSWARPDSINGTADFTGTPDYTTAMGLAAHGWTEGREKMVAGLSVLAAAEQRAPVSRLDVAGAYPIAAMAAAGDMQCMVDMGSETRSRAIHRLICNVSASGGTPADHIINRGVAICAMVDAIEAGDDRCEIFAHMAVSVSGDVLDILVELKAADQPLEIDRIAFALAHPSMLRRLMFRQIELNRPESQYGFHYGMPTNAPADTMAGAVYFPSMGMDRNNYTSPAAALATVRAAMAHHGVTVAGGEQ